MGTLNGISRSFLLFVVALMCAGMLSSCIMDAGDCPDDYPQEFDSPTLALHVSTLSTRAGEQPSVIERIRSLRVVVLGKESIEYNRLLTAGNSGAAGFEYNVILPVAAGKKNVYLIANEESVTGINGTASTLSQLLDSYGVESGAGPNLAANPDPAAFEAAVRGVYFAPVCTPEADGSVYLPYATCYEELEVSEREVHEVNLYLVPVAAKFEFDFTNYRKNPVDVNTVSVSALDSENYLLARPAGTETYKDFGSETGLYWVDWLARVAEASHETTDADGNQSFNEIYGWISDYAIPESSLQDAAQLVSAEDNISIPAASDKDTPGKRTLGPFYRPESRYGEKVYEYPAEEDGQAAARVTEQTYTLKLSLSDSSTAKGIVYEERIANLKALFRNTHVIVHIGMREGDVEIYAEIASWTRKNANGWLVEGPAPN